MKHQSARRSSLFLMELILAILFFSLASAVCVRLFAASHTIGNDTQNLNMAVTQAQSAAEVLSGCNGDLSSVQPLFADSVLEDDSLHVYYDASWKMASADNCSYSMEILMNKAADPVQYQIIVSTKEGKQIYELNTAYHTPVTIEQAE